MIKRIAAWIGAIAISLTAPAVVSWAGATPASAFTVPDVHVMIGDQVREMPAKELGVTRDVDGLLVDDAKLDAVLASIVEGMGRAAEPGRYELTPNGPVVIQGKPGLAIDLESTRNQLIESMKRGKGSLEIAIQDVAAPPPPANLIIVNLASFRLDLYEGAQHTKEYEIGVGALKFPTPPGAYFIRSKAKNPSWNNPGSSWARSMPRSIGPGPKNPLGTRALRLDRQALVIHGTPQPSTVGRRSSHGCIRMRNGDVQDLFDRVAQGTQVFIVP